MPDMHSESMPCINASHSPVIQLHMAARPGRLPDRLHCSADIAWSQTALKRGHLVISQDQVVGYTDYPFLDEALAKELEAKL